MVAFATKITKIMATVSDKVQISLSKPKDDSNDEKLPKLSEEDFRIYNNIAAEMEVIVRLSL